LRVPTSSITFAISTSVFVYREPPQARQQPPASSCT
jgi:hypothetical protein